MNRGFVVGLASAVSIVGAGCAWNEPIVVPEIAQPINEVFRERPIAQEDGFGTIPSVPPPRLRPGSSGSVRLDAEMPQLPPMVTVLRRKPGVPNDSQLRNISAALDLPGGLVGGKIVGQELAMSWTDEAGFRWTFDGEDRRISFSNETQPLALLTVSAPPDRDRLIERAFIFLDEHGIRRTRFGEPYLEPDWSTWWSEADANGQCMNLQAIQAIRTHAPRAGEPTIPPFPQLPAREDANCLPPEFPARLAVRFNATQDEQSIFTENGAPVPGAILVMDVASAQVVSGWFSVPLNPDRSDYPALSPDDSRQRLLSGGQGGTPDGDVAINNITFEWYEVTDAADPPTRYLYPALVGTGEITLPDGRKGPYRIVVPLVRS